MSIRWYPTTGGIMVPSVTSVLKVAFPAPVAKDEETAARWEYLRDRGTNIHALIAQGSVSREQMDSLPDDVQYGLYAWQRFVMAYGYRAFETELEMASADQGYGGRPDSSGRIPMGRVFVDWKSGRLIRPYVAMQLGGYYGLYVERYPRRKLRGALGVRLDCKTGNFEAMSLSEGELKQQHRAFLQVLQRFNEQQREEEQCLSRV